MRNADKLIAIVLAAVFAAFFAAAAQAQQSVRTFVSGLGTDGGSCSRSAPCRTFTFALGQTAPAGEIVVLDSAGYGSVAINQPVTISNPGGVEAGIATPSGGTAITITASYGSVTLRGLTLEGNGVAANGIVLSSSLSGSPLTVNILGCVIKDFTGDGILLEPTSSGLANVVIADSTITGNATGIVTNPTNASLSPSIYRTIVSSNGIGMNLSPSSGTTATLLMSSHVDNNFSGGIEISGFASLTMKNSSAFYNTGGFDDVANNGTLELFDRNTIAILTNDSGGYTDGSNNIQLFQGTIALTKINPQ